jgi:hypothetical protein
MPGLQFEDALRQAFLSLCFMAGATPLDQHAELEPCQPNPAPLGLPQEA